MDGRETNKSIWHYLGSRNQTHNVKKRFEEKTLKSQKQRSENYNGCARQSISKTMITKQKTQLHHTPHSLIAVLNVFHIYASI